MSGKAVSPELRFWRYVAKTDGCWEWVGGVATNGYGRFHIAGSRREQAHRFAWRLSGRSLDPNLTLDHLCRNRLCVNPDHLEQVTMAENLRRGMGWAGLNARKTHCANGHPYNAENTYRPPSRNGWSERECWTCKAERKRRYRRVAREARQANV